MAIRVRERKKGKLPHSLRSPSEAGQHDNAGQLIGEKVKIQLMCIKLAVLHDDGSLGDQAEGGGVDGWRGLNLTH